MHENITILWGHLIVDELIRLGVDYFCVSPGSRSTPLTVAVARHPRARAVVAYDERGAAFHAVGYVRATGRPAALICTSGTALANYLPAVVEADVDHVPLLVLSADRPPELRETAANQTVRQPAMLGDAVRWRFDLPAPDETIAPAFVLTTVDQAVWRAQQPVPGPVHLNCIFREPLAPVVQPVAAGYTAELARWLDSAEPFTTYLAPAPAPVMTVAGDLLPRLARSPRGVIAVGRLPDARAADAVWRLADHLGWPVLPDIQSQMRLGALPPDAVPDYDLALLDDAPPPDAVLQLGSPSLSKRWLQLITRARPPLHVVVNPYPDRQDPAHTVTHRVVGDVAAFCAALAQQPAGTVDPAWRAFWFGRTAARSADRAAAVDRFLAEQPAVSEISTARTVTRLIPPEHGLWLASSMPVRDADTFGWAESAAAPRPGPRVAANRGASGIDGTVAAAAGFAAGLGQPVTLLIGDLALLHDLNGLALLHAGGVKLIVVVLNNQGGGIFSLLPIARFDAVFERFFGTPHGYTFADAARLFGVAYAAPTTDAELAAAYATALAAPGSTLIEVRTERDANAALHRQIQDAVRRV